MTTQTENSLARVIQEAFKRADRLDLSDPYREAARSVLDWLLK